MRDEKKQQRHAAITQAAYQILAGKGYDGTSMLSIARQAKASNETLYRWYGDKRGLFEAMVRDNAAETKAALEHAISGEDDPVAALERVTPLFLTMILGDPAILLNRAAAADPTGALGEALSAGGRNEVQPLFDALMQRIRATYPPSPQAPDPKQMTNWYLGLLISDRQIKRVIGTLPPLSNPEIAKCAKEALDAFLALVALKSEAAEPGPLDSEAKRPI